VKSYNGYIRVSLDWTNASANANYRYEVYRSSGGSEQFVTVGVVEQGSSYFDDQNDLYKTVDQFFKYKVIAVGSSGPQGVSSNIMSVTYSINNTNAARRTWGSIKAMFR
jgi:D-serine dehydratase